MYSGVPSMLGAWVNWVLAASSFDTPKSSSFTKLGDPFTVSSNRLDGFKSR